MTEHTILYGPCPACELKGTFITTNKYGDELKEICPLCNGTAWIRDYSR